MPPTYPQATLDQAALTAADPASGRFAWPERDLAVLGLIGAVGVRPSELVALQGRDLAEDGASLIVGTKSRRRELQVPSETVAALHQYCEVRPRGPGSRSERPVFVGRDGSAISMHTVTATLERLIPSREGGYAARIRRLRGNAAYARLRDGGTVDELRQFLGDHRKGVAERYALTASAGESAGDTEVALTRARAVRAG